MNKLSNTLSYLIALVFIALVNINCSNVPSTQYYTLVADSRFVHDKMTPPQISSNIKNVGIGPLIIPNSLDSFSIISIEDNNQIVINPYQLWAGNLKSNMNQVLADNIASILDQESIWPFPWDNRNRPKIQVRIVFERFIGELGKEVVLQAKWTVLDEYGKKEIKTEKTIIKEPLNTLEYLDYVKTLNDTLNQFSLIIADELKKL